MKKRGGNKKGEGEEQKFKKLEVATRPDATVLTVLPQVPCGQVQSPPGSAVAFSVLLSAPELLPGWTIVVTLFRLLSTWAKNYPPVILSGKGFLAHANIQHQ